MIDIFKKAVIDLKSFDIERCHRLPSGCINTSNNEHVIVKFVNRNYSETVCCLKQSISSHSNIFITNLPSPYYCFLWGNCKNLHRKNRPLIKILLENDYWFIKARLGWWQKIKFVVA